MVDLDKFEFMKSDGRSFVFFQSKGLPAPEFTGDGIVRPEHWQPPENRYHAMRGEWVAISTNRNHRPFLPPKDYCPLCPVSHLANAHDAEGKRIMTEIPESQQQFEVAAFENLFPALSSEGKKTGRCEVLLYSPNHEQSLAAMELDEIRKVIHMWQDRSLSVGKLSHIKQIQIFENRGEQIGVTLHHPHGQLYAWDHVPSFILKEQRFCRSYYEDKNSCFHCDLLANKANELEPHHDKRVVFENDFFVAYVPYAARFPYELHLAPKRHLCQIEDLTEDESDALALAVKDILFAYNHLFFDQGSAVDMPYMMIQRQAPTAEGESKAIHWHIQFYPFLRSLGKLKYLAGSESGANFFVNDTLPETKAGELRDALKRKV